MNDFRDRTVVAVARSTGWAALLTAEGHFKVAELIRGGF